LRRRKDTVRDIDILIVSKKPKKVMDSFVKMHQVKRVLAHGETKSSVIAGDNNIQVDLRVVEKKSFGSALVYFTGSKQFNINLRHLAIKKGYKINEYGVFKGTKCVASKTEKDIFSLMKMDYIAPELREDRGEIEAAQESKLPVPIKRSDIKGDLHVHSDYSDGTVSIEEIAKYSKKLGYEYIAITDHSQSLKVANGLDEEAVYRKIEEVKKVNKKVKGITVLCGTEVDILTDASIDYPDRLLKEFDIVVAAIHVGFKQSKAQQTKRLISACKNKYVHVIAHPTGRLLGERDEYELDMDELIKAAKDNNKALEINCSYLRLDLNDINCLKAKRAGVKFALGTDSHHFDQYEFIDLGISVANRGWVEKNDVLNSMNLANLKKWLKR
jgi:DNA polymerase (family 10)